MGREAETSLSESENPPAPTVIRAGLVPALPGHPHPLQITQREEKGTNSSGEPARLCPSSLCTHRPARPGTVPMQSHCLDLKFWETTQYRSLQALEMDERRLRKPPSHFSDPCLLSLITPSKAQGHSPAGSSAAEAPAVPLLGHPHAPGSPGNTAWCSPISFHLLSFPEREQKPKREGNDKTPARS